MAMNLEWQSTISPPGCRVPGGGGWAVNEKPSPKSLALLTGAPLMTWHLQL